jgi:hypothetical protein
MKFEKYLPIGSVVLLKNGKHRIMVTGFCYIDNSNNSKMYDYRGCLYPEGIIDDSNLILFNHDQINKVFCLGLSDKEEKDFKSTLVSTVEIVNKNK